MTTASHPSTHQSPGCTSGASSPVLRQAIFSTDSTRRLVVGYVSFDSRLVVVWWSVTCRLVVDWWSVMCRFLPATFGLNPCQSSLSSQNPPRNSITTIQNPPKPTPILSLPAVPIAPEPPDSASRSPPAAPFPSPSTPHSHAPSNPNPKMRNPQSPIHTIALTTPSPHDRVMLASHAEAPASQKGKDTPLPSPKPAAAFFDNQIAVRHPIKRGMGAPLRPAHGPPPKPKTN